MACLDHHQVGGGEALDIGEPFIIVHVTNGWPALRHWEKQEIICRYPVTEAMMGEARLLDEYGMDIAGEVLTQTAVGGFVTEHMCTTRP